MKMLNKKGFTLIELIGVIIIIAVLAGIAIPKVLQYVEKAKVTALAGDVKTLQQAAVGYYADTSSTATTMAKLVTDTATGWDGPYLPKEIVKDAWGTAISVVTANASAADTVTPGAGTTCTVKGLPNGGATLWLEFTGIKDKRAIAMENKIDRSGITTIAADNTTGAVCINYTAGASVVNILIASDQ